LAGENVRNNGDPSAAAILTHRYCRKLDLWLAEHAEEMRG